MDRLSELPPVFVQSGKAAFDLQVDGFQFHITFAGEKENQPDIMKAVEEILQASYSL